MKIVVWINGIRDMNRAVDNVVQISEPKVKLVNFNKNIRFNM
ncbi:MAG TPA: hypothetical protein VK071_11400 [Tissierellales bacterium]|nr:hypothetical protein [Tissierellales bacterium]